MPGLPRAARALVAFGQTGYICAMQNLSAAADAWRPAAIPLTSLMGIEMRKGRPTPVIGKALVRTDGRAFRTFAEQRLRWEVEDDYVYPGAIQYFGPAEVAEQPPMTLALENEGDLPPAREESR